MLALVPFKVLWDLATSRLGLPIVVLAIVVVAYEGLPIGPLRYVPYAGQYIAMVFDGRIDHVRTQARADAENESRAAAMALIEKKSQNHEEISTFDSSRLCGELGGRWVPNERRCD